MIKFLPRKQVAVALAPDDVSVLSVANERVTVMVRVSLPREQEARLTIKRATSRQAPLTSQLVSDLSELSSQLAAEVLCVTRFKKSPESSTASKLQVLSTVPDSDIRGAFLRGVGPYHVARIAAQSLSDKLSPSTVSQTFKTHFAVTDLTIQDALEPLSVCVSMLNGDTVIGESSVVCSLATQIMTLRAVTADPIMRIRDRASCAVVTVKCDSQARLFKRDVRQYNGDRQGYELIAAVQPGESEINVSCASDSTTLLMCVAGDDLESCGARAVKLSTRNTATCNVLAIRAAVGCEILLSDIVGADTVIVKKTSRSVTEIIATELVLGRDAIVVHDERASGICVYDVELLSASNSIRIAPAIIDVDGNGLGAAPIIANVLTVAVQGGFKTTFDLSQEKQRTDASVARTLVLKQAPTLFDDELHEQRDLYDELVAFSVSRVSKQTGLETLLGVVSSGSFSDVLQSDAGERSVRYVVSSVSRDAESTLSFKKTVSGSAQPYAYAPAVFRHPYALQDGLLSSPRLRNLRHPSVDIAAGKSRAVATVDVTLPSASETDVIASASALGDRTLITISDERHLSRECYVIAGRTVTDALVHVATKHALSPRSSVICDERLSAVCVAVVDLDFSVSKLLTIVI